MAKKEFFNRHAYLQVGLPSHTLRIAKTGSISLASRSAAEFDAL